jgi:5-methylcytosine-specific restriction endonuclease McrA
MIFKITGKLGLDGITYINRDIDKPRKRKQSAHKAFIATPEWKEVRAKAVALYGAVCMKCGSTDHIQVDHVKPRSKYPEIALDINNLQILCWDCNKEKSFFHDTDYRGNVGKSIVA